MQQWGRVIEENTDLKIKTFKKSASAKVKNIEILKNDYDVIVINFEVLYKMTNLLKLVNENWTIIIDEGHRIKSVGTRKSPVKVTTFALQLGELTPFKIILTATPTQGAYGGYIDYYSQLKFLGYFDKTITAFKDRYVLEAEKHIRGRMYPIRTIVGYKNTDELDGILKLMARRYVSKFGDYEPEHIEVKINRSSKYAKTERERVYKDIVLTNSSRKRIAMKTLTTGVITGMNEFGERFNYEDNSNKLKWLEEFLKDTDETVAVYYHYKVELASLKKLCEKLGKTYIEVNGTTKDKYAEVNDKEYDVLLGQYQSASESIDGLQHKCHIQVLFALPESSLLYKQAIGRIDRDGQTQVPTYYYLIMEKTVDEQIWEMIVNKVEFSEITLNKLMIKER